MRERAGRARASYVVSERDWSVCLGTCYCFSSETAIVAREPPQQKGSKHNKVPLVRDEPPFRNRNQTSRDVKCEVTLFEKITDRTAAVRKKKVGLLAAWRLPNA